MSNSKLVNHTKLSPNNYGKRTLPISRITPHCVVGQCSVEALGQLFYSTTRQASSNYGIGADGRVGLYVNEDCAAWTSSNYGNDQRSVTIECASDTFHPYAMNSKVYNTLVKLCIDICKRNKKTKLVWIPNKEKALAYVPKSNEMLLTVHRWFKNKACPGDWLYNRLGKLADAVNRELSKTSTKEFKIKVNTDRLVVREKASVASTKMMYLHRDEAYTIVETTKNGKWGKLKSGIGWIALKYVKKI